MSTTNTIIVCCTLTTEKAASTIIATTRCTSAIIGNYASGNTTYYNEHNENDLLVKLHLEINLNLRTDDYLNIAGNREKYNKSKN